MDSIHLTANRRTLEGLRLMMFDTIGDNEYVHASVELPIALYIVEVAKRNVDTEHYFPFGKWATIQAIQERIDKQLDHLHRKDVPHVQ